MGIGTLAGMAIAAIAAIALLATNSDYGMFLQSVMVAARARGLDTCPQAAFATFHQVIAAELRLPETRMVVCGMALGYADPDAIENQLVTDRAPLAEWAHFLS